MPTGRYVESPLVGKRDSHVYLRQNQQVIIHHPQPVPHVILYRRVNSYSQLLATIGLLEREIRAELVHTSQRDWLVYSGSLLVGICGDKERFLGIWGLASTYFSTCTRA